MRILLSTLMALGILMPPVMARPVSYPSGVTVSTTNDSQANVLLTHYSPTARYSIGHRLEYLRDDETVLNAFQANVLLKRWNGSDSQANLYLKNGIGIARSNQGIFDGELEPAAFTGFAADWEDRRYFVSYENRGLHTGDLGSSFAQKARVGVAPYIGDYGDLHTWLMLEVQHTPERENPVRIAPLVRLFKGVGLVEAGIDNQGDALFNFIYRF